MQLHAATTVDGRVRRRLERVCRDLLCPPCAHDALEALEDGHVRVFFKSDAPRSRTRPSTPSQPPVRPGTRGRSAPGHLLYSRLNEIRRRQSWYRGPLMKSRFEHNDAALRSLSNLIR